MPSSTIEYADTADSNLTRSTVLQRRDEPGDPVTCTDDGCFTYPDIFGATFAQGSRMNISWETIYTFVNLFIAQYGEDANSIAITSHSTVTSYIWVVKVPPGSESLRKPFHLRVVNANGDEGDQKIGGFWSSGFYIGGDDDEGDSKTTASRPAAIPSRSTQNAASNSIPASTSSRSRATIPSPTTSTSTTSSASPSTQAQATSDTSSTSSSSSTASLNPGAKAGVGVGVTFGTLLLIVLVIGFLWLARRMRRQNAGAGAAGTTTGTSVPVISDPRWPPDASAAAAGAGQQTYYHPAELTTHKEPQELPPYRYQNREAVSELPGR
ncbi:MAG: hypothetical protein M1831_006269 [Alyxoria varia]|nr:MAG: hypothetical protein M1831_006269 [Alyxoria varia]